MDVSLSGSVNGLAAAEEINRICHIPTVILASHTSEEMLTKAIAAGAHGYLLKPHRAEELKATLVLALEQHHSAIRLFSKCQQLQTMVGTLSDAIVATDSDGQIRYLNSVAEVLTGWSSHDAVGRNVDEILSDRLRAVESSDGQQVALSQLRRALATRKPVGRERFYLRQRYGNRIPIEESAAPIVEAHEPVSAVSIFRNISDRLRRERAAELLTDRLAEQSA